MTARVCAIDDHGTRDRERESTAQTGTIGWRGCLQLELAFLLLGRCLRVDLRLGCLGEPESTTSEHQQGSDQNQQHGEGAEAADDEGGRCDERPPRLGLVLR